MQSKGMEMSRARLQIFCSGKSICVNRGHAKAMAASDEWKTTPPEALRTISPWSYTGLCKRFSYSLGVPFWVWSLWDAWHSFLPKSLFCNWHTSQILTSAWPYIQCLTIRGTWQIHACRYIMCCPGWTICSLRPHPSPPLPRQSILIQTGWMGFQLIAQWLLQS